MRSPPTRRRESRHFWKNGVRVGRESRVFLRVVLLKPKSLDHEHCERSSTIAPSFAPRKFVLHRISNRLAPIKKFVRMPRESWLDTGPQEQTPFDRRGPFAM